MRLAFAERGRKPVGQCLGCQQPGMGHVSLSSSAVWSTWQTLFRQRYRELLSRVNSMVRILRAERGRDLLIVELRKALAEIKNLSGLLPICSHCKQIRDDKGYWSKLESYISAHSDA
jgi:hypothetical protein